MQLTARLYPQLLLLDLRMPGPRPANIARWVRNHCPETETLVLTAHDIDRYIAEMIEAGTAGFLTKEKAEQALLGAIRRAARGEILYTQEQRDRAHRWREEVGQRWESLTRREREVLRLLMEGLDNKAIAERLCVKQKTVEYHVTNILKKLGCASRLEAVVWVHDHFPDDLWKS
jgi:two-component system response regulator DevR